MLPPPANIGLVASAPLLRGTAVTIEVTLPVALDGIRIYLPTTEGGVGAGACPAALGGDCLSIVGALDLYGPEYTTGGVATFLYFVAPGHPTNQVAFQAVARSGSSAYLSAPLVLPVLDEDCDNGVDDDLDGRADCADPGCSSDAWCSDEDGDGLSPQQGDCDDGSGAVYPGAPETNGDGVDSDCNGMDSGPWVSPSTGMVMASIDPGTFLMGCEGLQPECYERAEGPIHEITLTQGFHMAVTEVTQADYAFVMGTNPSWYASCGGDCPVEQVNWYDAVAYANALSLLDGFDPAYTIVGTTTTWDMSANGYRLPTEAEWEYAARANDGTRYPGSDTVADVSWHDQNANTTPLPVALLQPNGFGLYDMGGNVNEWCWDWWDIGYYASSPSVDPIGPAPMLARVRRGGSYNTVHSDHSVSSRTSGMPEWRLRSAGFRVVRTSP
jgi:formylglycine-generating enzyme required for sulfatase activity